MRMLPLLFLASPAAAHTGHLGDLGGHDHWGLAAGLGAIAAAAALGWWKGRKPKETAEEAPDEAPEEQPA